MDDEAHELELERVLSRIGEDADLRQAWMRYHAARDAASGPAQRVFTMDVSQQVRAAVAAEGRPQRSSLAQRLARPAASFAVAASVAAAVIFGAQQLSPLAPGPQAPVAATGSPAVTTPGIGGTPTYASYGAELQPAPSSAYRELARQRMQKYMQEHAEHAALNSPQGLIPFARVPRISQ